MRNCRRFFSASTAVFIALLAALSCAPRPDIIGTWREVGRTATLDFGDDGRFTAVDNQGMTVTGSYRLQTDGTIQFQIRHENSPPETLVGRVKRQGDELISSSADGKEVEIYRKAAEPESREDFLYDFLPGSYELLGRLPDSEEIYRGTVLLTAMDTGELQVVRQVDDSETRAVGRIETAAVAETPVLRIRFMEKDGGRYEATYLLHTDLDNYPRLTGYIYLLNGKTEVPGIEVLFPLRP